MLFICPESFQLFPKEEEIVAQFWNKLALRNLLNFLLTFYEFQTSSASSEPNVTVFTVLDQVENIQYIGIPCTKGSFSLFLMGKWNQLGYFAWMH